MGARRAPLPAGAALSYNIAIDARKLRDFGIGTYVRNLIRELAEIDRENTCWCGGH